MSTVLKPHMSTVLFLLFHCRVQPIFDWMFEVEDGASDADDSGRIILSLEYEMNSNMQETYGSVENRVVARLHIQQDHISSIVPVVKVRKTEPKKPSDPYVMVSIEHISLFDS